MRHMRNTQSSSAEAGALLAVLLRSDGTRPDTAGCVPRMVYFITEQGAVAYAVAAAPPDVFDMLQSKEYLAEDSEGTGKIPMVVRHNFDWFEEFKRLKFYLPGESSGVPDPEAADPEAADLEAADPEAADPEGPMSQVEGIVFGQLMKRLTRLGLDTTQPKGCDDLLRDIFGARPIELLERGTGGDQVSVVYLSDLKPEEVRSFLKHASKEWRALFDPSPSTRSWAGFLWPAVAVGFTAGTIALYWVFMMMCHHDTKTAPIMNRSILGIGNSSLNNTTANTPPSVDKATLGISSPLTETIGLLKSTISSPTSGPRALGFPTSGSPTSSSPTSGSPTCRPNYFPDHSPDHFFDHFPDQLPDHSAAVQAVA
ncbi:putative transmembrane protein [Gregarina niphandrodes]|uniref:Transmembrane protein n=1 Tax=Gregarina niphandrodes TaxID=110365 RepID=A0A023AYG8_GRENI|nr:putative transmembrane protein [Gregarina niphandrodes]EZG43706.1 putative transmembrane protein [Gregarina niphandrodes]|eukprot:XP_011133063.1 putative transmembrane protein [Gregarina niphandrodes]